MLKHVALLAAVTGSLVIVGCENNPSTSSQAAGTPEAPAATAPAGNPRLTGATLNADPLASAENRDLVKQPADDVKIHPTTVELIAGFSPDLRDAPGGRPIGHVEAMQNVTEVAHDPIGDYFLVVFNDPKDVSKHVAGWVNKEALENTGWASAEPPASETSKKLACSKGEAHMRAQRDFCAKKCTSDGDCDQKAGGICDGLAFEVDAKGHTSNARYCMTGAPKR